MQFLGVIGVYAAGIGSAGSGGSSQLIGGWRESGVLLSVCVHMSLF